MKNKTKKALGIVGFVLLNAIVLFFTARDDFSQTRSEALGILAPAALVSAAVCVVVTLAAETAKNLLMMRHLKEKRSVRNAFETAALGKYYDFITPSGAGGQPFQIWHLHRAGYSDGAAAAIPLAGFITMQFAFVLLAIVAFIFGWRVVASVPMKILACIGLVAYTVVPTLIVLSAFSLYTAMKLVRFFLRLGQRLHLCKSAEDSARSAEAKLKSYSISLKAISANRALLVVLMLLSLVYQIAMCSIPYFVLRAFGSSVSYLTSLAMCAFVYASVTIVPTPGNAGAAEGSFYLLFDQLGNTGVFWPMLIWRLFSFYAYILVGLGIYAYHFIQKLFRRRNRHGEENHTDDPVH